MGRGPDSFAKMDSQSAVEPRFYSSPIARSALVPSCCMNLSTDPTKDEQTGAITPQKEDGVVHSGSRITRSAHIED